MADSLKFNTHSFYNLMYNMKKIKLFLLTLVALVVTPVVAQDAFPPLPVDKEVRMGKLPNGLTYYIRHNEEPKGQVNFYIAQKVGSVQEDDNQRGLAHFLEHMAFNGSKHFAKDGQLIKYCESIGVKFGENLNAYTSTDETVYNIDNVPVKGSNVDSCLLILADWSGGLLLEKEEIQKERGVIHEEWRMRSSAVMRILEKRLPELYPGSKYGHRMPIGLMEIIDNFEPDFLRAYYKKWYRPDLQGVVIVGDINVDEVEAKVKTILGAVVMPENAAKYETYPVPENDKAIYVIDKDKELTMTALSFMYKTEPMPEAMRGTVAEIMQNYLLSLATQGINARLSEMAQKEDCPFLNAGVSYENYLLSKTADCFSVNLTPKPGKDAAAVTAVMAEIQRAAKFGLSKSEVKRASENVLSNIEAIYNNRTKQKHNFYTSQYVRHFLEKKAIPSIEDEYNTYKMLASMIDAEAVNGMIKELTADNEKNFVFLGMYPDNEKVKVATVDEMKAAVAAGVNAKVEAYVDNVKAGPLITKLPKKGKIVKTSTTDFGYKQWTLSNGARVFFKKTDFNDAQVLFQASSFGGSSKFAEKDLANARLIEPVMESVGWGGFTSTELEKKLTGKQVALSSGLSNYTESLSGSSTPKDLRTLFELIYLRFQRPMNDVDAYRTVINAMRTGLENADKNPQKAFSDSVRTTVYGKNPRKAQLTLADLKKANYEKIKQLYAERFSKGGDFDFYFTGAVNEDSLRAFTEQYIATLPAVQKRETYTKLNLDARKGVVENRFERQMETPQAMLLQIWQGQEPYSLKEAQVASVFGAILTKRYLKSIREDGGMAYNVGADASLSYGVKDLYSLQIFAPFTPEKVDSVLLLMDQGLNEIAKDGVTDEELSEVKKFEHKEYEEAQRSNGYWQGLMVAKNNWGKDGQKTYLETLDAVTSEDIKAFVNHVLLRDRNRATIIMLPKGVMTKK